ncbi:MAG: TIGR00282 family metallophosphoesterase [Candidatus Saccharimonadales bacterium]
MNILYVGDVMGEYGIRTIREALPAVRKEHAVDVVIAQAENVSSGKGMNAVDYQMLRSLGVDGFTGGNHTIADREIFSLLSDPAVPVTGPANMHDCPGPGYKYVGDGDKKVLIISLLGHIVGRDADKPIDNPLQTIDTILESQKEVERVATIVNFHGDFSSEKVVIGHYLDGRVTAVVGDHWHVPTADARVLPAGTAHMTDVGMCGALDSSLGVTYESIIPRWRDGLQTKNVLAANGLKQFNALLVTTNDAGLAQKTAHIQKYL